MNPVGCAPSAAFDRRQTAAVAQEAANESEREGMIESGKLSC